MNVLAIESSTDTLGLALKREDSLFSFVVEDGKKHSERLVLLADQLYREAGIKPEETDLVVCSQGPGSFTGLRIGMSTAKGIALAAGCPWVSVPSLEPYGVDLSFFDGAVIPLMDARRNRFYTAVYSGGERKTEVLDASPDQILALLEPWDRVLFTGPDCGLFYGIMQRGVYFDKGCRDSRVSSLLRLGIQKFRNQGGGDPREAGPLYIRRSDAEESKGPE